MQEKRERCWSAAVVGLAGPSRGFLVRLNLERPRLQDHPNNEICQSI